MVKPLYQQIYLDLENDIRTGHYPPGSQLPTEKELSDTYQVSRITSKRALTELEVAGLIYRVRGKGSFVNDADNKESRKANRILFLLPFMNDLSLGNFTAGLGPVMQENNSDIMMAPLEYLNQKKTEEITTEFDGLIYYAENTDRYLDILAEFAMIGFPVVLLDKKIYDLPFPAVVSDNVEGGYEATQFLIEKGHQRIAYLFGETLHAQSVRQRYLGYLQAIKEADLSFNTAIDDERATLLTLQTYVQEHHITALVCENDLTAIKAMKVLKEVAISVPGDISLIGFDDIQAAGLVDPPLTTIAQDFETLGRTAGQHLIQWIEKNERPTDCLIPVKLIDRQTTKELMK